MPTSCCAYGCTNNSMKKDCLERNVSYHKFPLENQTLLKAWLVAIRRDNFKPTIYTKICSDHFTDDNFTFQKNTNRRLLKENAIPSLFSFKKEKSVRRRTSHTVGTTEPEITEMYVIVEFILENKVDCVPQSWIESPNICFWPPNYVKPDEVSNLIKYYESPNEDWQKCAVNILGKADSYSDARAYCIMDVDGSSELTTDCDAYGQEKHKRFPKRAFSPSSNDDDDEAGQCRRTFKREPPSPPILNLPVILSTNSVFVPQSRVKELGRDIVHATNFCSPDQPVADSYSDARAHCIKDVDGSSELTTDCDSYGRGKRKRFPKRAFSPSSDDDGEAGQFRRTIKIEPPSPPIPNLPVILSTDSVLVPQSKVKELGRDIVHATNFCSPGQPVAGSEFEKFVVETLTTFKLKIDDIISMQQSISKRLESLEDNMTLGKEASNNIKLPVFPLICAAELDALEEDLKDDLFKRTLIMELKKIGGHNLTAIVNRIMSHIMSPALAVNYSWLGVKGNKCFSSLRLCDVLFETVRKQVAEATNADICRPASTWLRHAKEKLKSIKSKKQ